MASGPLDGIRILEFTQIIAGPFGGMLLADMGAEMIKVEPIGGEAWRLQAQFAPLESKSYQALNRGKLSLSLDLTRPECQQVIHRLTLEMDAVVINYRPDVAEKLRIDYETLRQIKPDLVYVDSTAFGRQGPMADWPGYDLVVQSFSGLTAAGARFDEHGTPLQVSPAPVVDNTTGYAIAWATCAALLYKERTGRGQLVETSLLANALMVQYGSFMSLPAADGETRTAFLERLRQAREDGRSYREFAEDSSAAQRRAYGGGGIYYRCFNTRDGAIAVGNLSAALREKMQQVLGVEDIRDQPGYDPTAPESIEFAQRLTARVEEMIAAETTRHWVDMFVEAGVPVAPIEFIQELDQHPQILANELVAELHHDITGPQTQVAPPIKMSVSPPRPQGASPPLGRDNDRILATVGYSAEEIESMRAAGAIR